MNWGYKIIIVYIVFVAGILLLVFKSSVQNQDLVAIDYYEQELRYQQKIDETERANALPGTVRYELTKDAVIIYFPQEMKGNTLTADILLYAPADKRRDFQKKMVTENAVISFPLPRQNKGLHKLKITWEVNGTTYYYEHKIMIT